MDQAAIFGPLFAMIALTFVVWVYMYARRIAFIQSGVLTPEELSNPARFAAASPPHVSNPSDNLKNLFEMPVLFYALALTLHAMQQVDAVYVGAAWCFFGFRCLHSAMHCTANVVLVRFYLYAASSIALWLMAGRAMWSHLAG